VGGDGVRRGCRSKAAQGADVGTATPCLWSLLAAPPHWAGRYPVNKLHVSLPVLVYQEGVIALQTVQAGCP
jgi:hypothetical protein